jgi:hypothetical protein
MKEGKIIENLQFSFTKEQLFPKNGPYNIQKNPSKLI